MNTTATLSIDNAIRAAVAQQDEAVYHSVSPVKAGETRSVVAMQFVTFGEMNPFMRFISNMKDAVGYFGLRGVSGAGKRKPAQ